MPFVGSRRVDLGVPDLGRYSTKEVGGPGYGGFYKKDFTIDSLSYPRQQCLDYNAAVQASLTGTNHHKRELQPVDYKT